MFSYFDKILKIVKHLCVLTVVNTFIYMHNMEHMLVFSYIAQ